jgi:NAD(P)-dependent dehydrogenase (short-subunit alcohol dehydrogenase family)
MLVRSLAVTLAEDGIRVNGIGPGLVKTRLNDYASSSDPELQELMRSQIPLGRIGEPDDIAGAAVFLASPMAHYITGHMLYVDGGIIAQQMVTST